MTDARLDLALRRAAVPVMRTSLTEADELRAGWAEAIRLMGETRNKLRHVASYLDRTGGDEENDHGFAFALRQDAEELDKAIRRFCTAMLGEEKSE